MWNTYEKYKKYEQSEKRKASKRPYSRLYYLRNKEKHKKVSAFYYRTHKEQRMRDMAFYRKAHPEIQRRIAKIRDARERGAEGNHTEKEWQEIKKKYNYCCAICKKQEPFSDIWYPLLTEDHIVPLCKNGTNYIWNIQPLCFACNIKKGTKIE